MYLTIKPHERYLKTPYLLVLIYTTSTFALSLFGPVKYLHYTPIIKILSAIYIILFLVFTWIGMSLAMKDDKKYNKAENDKKISTRNYRMCIRTLNIATLISLIIKVLLMVSSLILMGLPRFSTFFETLASVYTTMHRSEAIGNIFRVIDTFSTFITYFAVLGNMYLWKSSSKLRKVIVTTIIVLDLFYNLFFIGTQRSLFTYAIFIITYFLIFNAKSNTRMQVSKRIKAIAGISVLVILSMNILYARKQFWNSDFSIISFSSGISYDFNNIFIRFLPQQLKYNISTVVSYFTQGYYGLGLSLMSDFQWTYGTGSARGLSSILRQIFPILPDMTNYTYPIRVGLNYGFDGLVHWYTIFPWLASDLTFLGALFYMGAVGFLYMKVWIEVIRYNNIISFTILALLNIQYLFIVANNQLFVTRGESLATIILFLTWLFLRKNFNWVDQNKIETK